MGAVTSSRSGATQRLGRALVVLAALPPLLCLGPHGALAAERVITISADGLRPQVLQVRAGDTVRFVNEDRTFAYRAQSTGGAWRFDSGPVTLLTSDFVVPEPLTRPGTYTFRVAQDPPYRGSVVLAGAPAPPGSPQPSPVESPTAQAPEVASPGAPDPGASAAGVPSATAPVPPSQAAPPAAPGTLPGPPSSGGLGLPTALAVVLAAGAASLLLRLLLTEPVLSDRPGTL